MKKSIKNSNKKPFNIIYIEEKALDYPITNQLLKRYSDCNILKIKHYKDVFNRPNQHFEIQKKKQSLILAVKSKPFLYKGPKVCQSFGYDNFYYSSLLLNCIFNCEYCFLKGMYPSANLVAFVNTEDFKIELTKALSDTPSLLALSYDTDLIAFNNVIPYIEYFYDFFVQNQNISVEIRTKSANEIFYKKYTPSKNIIIAFSLSPKEIINKYEKMTPSLNSRINAINTAIENGFQVRLCFDPVFIHPELDLLYEPFYKYVFERIDSKKIIDIGHGFFRIPKSFFKRIEKNNSNSQLFSEDYCVIDDVVSYPIELQEEVKVKHIKVLTRFIEKEKLFFY